MRHFSNSEKMTDDLLTQQVKLEDQAKMCMEHMTSVEAIDYPGALKTDTEKFIWRGMLDITEASECIQQWSSLFHVYMNMANLQKENTPSASAGKAPTFFPQEGSSRDKPNEASGSADELSGVPQAEEHVGFDLH